MSLIKEGITKDLLASINMDKQHSPVQLMPDETPVKLIKCGTGYWVMLEFGEYLKDEKNRLIVISDKDAKIGRARYMINYATEIEQERLDKLEEAINSEMDILKAKVDEKLNSDIKKSREILVLAGKIELEGIEKILTDAVRQANGSDPYNLNSNDSYRYEQRAKIAKELATPEFEDSYKLLLRLKENTPYNSLYQQYFQEGLPLVGSFQTNSPSDLEALKKLFSRSALDQTSDDMQNKDHLYMVAKVNVEKRLARS